MSRMVQGLPTRVLRAQDAGGWVGTGKHVCCKVCRRYAGEHAPKPCSAVLVAFKDIDANAESVQEFPNICRPILNSTYMYRTDTPSYTNKRYFFTGEPFYKTGDWTSLTWVDDAWAARWIATATAAV